MPFLPHRKCFLYQSCVFCPKYPISIFFYHFLSHFSSFLPHYWLRFLGFSVLPPFWKYLSLSNTSFYVMSDARHSGGRREAERRQNEGRTKARLQKDIITRMPHTSSFDTFFHLSHTSYAFYAYICTRFQEETTYTLSRYQQQCSQSA